MKLLAIDTATEACSAAVLSGDTIVMRYEEPGRGHAERILPMVHAVLADSGLRLADLDAIAVGRGPGAFTGVRIAVSVAQGLAFGADRPIVAVSDLAALAQRAVVEHGARRIVSCIDARMGEVYWAEFAVDPDNLVVAATEERVSSPDAVQVPAGAEWWGAGSGWALQSLTGRLPGASTSPRLLPRATEIALLGRRDFLLGKAVPAECALPVYLRDQVARPPSRDPGI